MSLLKKVVIGLLCLAFLAALSLSVASTVQQISTISSPTGMATNREHWGSARALFDVEPCQGDPGGGSRPGDIAPLE